MWKGEVNRAGRKAGRRLLLSRAIPSAPSGAWLLVILTTVLPESLSLEGISGGWYRTILCFLHCRAAGFPSVCWSQRQELPKIMARTLSNITNRPPQGRCLVENRWGQGQEKSSLFGYREEIKRFAQSHQHKSGRARNKPWRPWTHQSSSIRTWVGQTHDFPNRTSSNLQPAFEMTPDPVPTLVVIFQWLHCQFFWMKE